MLPKTECLDDLKSIEARLGSTIPVIALIETAKGLINITQILEAGNVAQIAFGSIDFALDLGCSESREALLYARCEIVLRNRSAGLPAPVDGATTEISDTEQLLQDCRHAASLGFGGKLAIHPKQIDMIQNAFLPAQAEVDWARRVLAALAVSAQGAVQLDGKMIDRPIADKARRILARIS